MSNENLGKIFEKVGKKYGYDSVKAEFVAYRDFKVKWTRSYKWAEFQVSDYLTDAPDIVIEGLAKTLFERILQISVGPYPQEMTDYITSPEFKKNKQPIYIRRTRGVTKSPVGENKDLTDSLQRLKDMGLVDKDVNPYLTWTKNELTSTVGYCSTLMDTVVMSSVFDDSTIPDSVLDFALYHELLNIREGWAGFGKGEEIDIVEEEEKFPDYKVADTWIRRLGLHL